MSHNPKRRLFRTNLQSAGWRTDRPRSGRRRGEAKDAAAHDVAVVMGIIRARSKMGKE